MLSTVYELVQNILEHCGLPVSALYGFVLAFLRVCVADDLSAFVAAILSVLPVGLGAEGV